MYLVILFAPARVLLGVVHVHTAFIVSKGDAGSAAGGLVALKTFMGYHRTKRHQAEF
jgi:hypothetical protein